MPPAPAPAMKGLRAAAKGPAPPALLLLLPPANGPNGEIPVRPQGGAPPPPPNGEGVALPPVGGPKGDGDVSRWAASSAADFATAKGDTDTLLLPPPAPDPGAPRADEADPEAANGEAVVTVAAVVAGAEVDVAKGEGEDVAGVPARLPKGDFDVPAPAPAPAP
mmetsp:Transcript_38101/g.57419  ORF Transcript_38101/g.57419 Transcript_38101/m.57419 type:complete len:164 (-) Transcript_38101:54-545(-)